MVSLNYSANKAVSIKSICTLGYSLVQRTLNTMRWKERTTILSETVCNSITLYKCQAIAGSSIRFISADVIINTFGWASFLRGLPRISAMLIDIKSLISISILISLIMALHKERFRCKLSFNRRCMEDCSAEHTVAYKLRVESGKNCCIIQSCVF